MTTEAAETVSCDIKVNEGGQDAFVRSTSPFPAYIAGRGSGKTAAVIIKVFLYCFENPGAVGILTEPTMPLVHTILMPRFRQLFGMWEGTLWRLTGKGSGQEQIEFLRPSEQIGVPRDSVILLRAALEPEKLVGFEMACGGLDEAAETSGGSQELAFLNLVGGLRQKGYQDGFLALTSTPKGFNWVWRQWHDDSSKIKPEHELFKGTALENKHNLKEGFWEQLKAEHGEGSPRWRQEALGEFVFMEGLVLSMFDPVQHVKPFPQDGGFARKVAGIDFGAHSPTAVVELRMNSAGQVWARERLYQRECTDEQLADACMALRGEGVSVFACDPSGKDRIEWLQRLPVGIPAYKAESNLLGMRVSAVSSLLGNNGLFITPDSPNLIQEFGGLAWAPARGRDMVQDKFDPRCPDHAFDATAYGCMELQAVPIDWKPPKITEKL